MAKASETKKEYCASIFPTESEPIPENLVNPILQLEKELGMPVWLLIQNENILSPLDSIGDEVWGMIVANEDDIPKENCALLINSAGGNAKSAYQIARLFMRTCKKFYVIVPRYAKSAATLLALGASRIIMAEHAELGPIDAQILDFEREKTVSALDEIQSLERLRAFGLESIDESMFLIVQRSGKKIETALPHVLHFIAEIMRPLLEQVDVVEYTQMSRVLKVAEEYAVRLLSENFPDMESRKIARHLVEHYPEHGFFIDADEATSIGLQMEKPSKKIDAILDDIYHCLIMGQPTIIGSLVEKE